MAQNYPLNKRRGGGAWQWMLIGFVPGFLCAAVIAIVAAATGALNMFSQPQVVEVTREIQVGIVVTSTPDPLASPAVVIITTTPEPTTEPEEGEPVLPTETPMGSNGETVVQTAQPTNTAEASAAEVTEESTRATSNNGTNNVASASGFPLPAEFTSGSVTVSTLVDVTGGNFQLGTTTNEVFAAAQECVNRDGGQCDPSSGVDSTPPVPVDISDFSIEQTEVSFNQYVAFLNYLKRQGLSHTTGCFNYICIQTANERPDAAVISYDGANYFIPSRLENLGSHAAYGVTWYGAEAYCRAIGRRLPTEAEWEYAARNGGQNNPYPWGVNWANGLANVRIPAIEGSGQSTVEVISISTGRNGLGLYHMAGNVAEWVNDYYDEFYYSTLNTQAQAAEDGGVDDPQGPTGGTLRSIRGGSFDTPPFFARTFHRQAAFPAPETPTGDFPLWVGFRCAADFGAQANSSSSTLPLGQIPTGGTAENNAQPTAPTSPEESATESGAPRG